MLISVCIPVKNSEWCLPYCLDSLKKQTIQPDEYLFCISPSKDKTYELIAQFKHKMESVYKSLKVQIIEDSDDLGTGYARKVLTDEAKGKYISWVDADFILPRNWIESLLYLEDKHSFDGLEGEICEITSEEADELKTKGELDFEIDVTSYGLVDIKWQGRYGMGRHLLKREHIIQVGNFDSFFTRGQTHDLTYRLSANNTKRFRCKGLKFYHTGLLKGYKKKGFIQNVLNRSTYLKFFYKYGLNILTMDKEHTLLFIYRVGLVGLFLLSIIFYKLWIFPLLTMLGVLGLFIGVSSRYGFKVNLFFIQIGKCIGELTTIYDIIVYKNRQPFGYGKKYLKQEEMK